MLFRSQPNLNTARIGAVEVPLPPIPQQRELVELLRSLDSRIDELSRRRSDLKLVASHAEIGGDDGIL